MLTDIINNVSDFVASSEREVLLRYINRAARNIYDMYDLPGSVMELEFCADMTETHITLPWYVKDLRAIRRVDTKSPVRLIDARPRFFREPWDTPLHTYRVIGETPLEQTITQAGRLVVTLQGAETDTVTVTILGQTTTSSQYAETLTFTPGETSKTTTKQFTQDQPFGIKSIVKAGVTTHDVVITQESDSHRIASIPCMLQRASNLLVNVREFDYQPMFGDTECLELLFKWPYIPLINDTDEFLRSDKYDDAVVWRACCIFEYKNATLENPKMAIARQEYTDQIQKISDNVESTVVKKLNVASDPYENAALGARYGETYA